MKKALTDDRLDQKLANNKKWCRVFLVAGTVMFLAGVALLLFGPADLGMPRWYPAYLAAIITILGWTGFMHYRTGIYNQKTRRTIARIDARRKAGS